MPSKILCKSRRCNKILLGFLVLRNITMPECYADCLSGRGYGVIVNWGVPPIRTLFHPCPGGGLCTDWSGPIIRLRVDDWRKLSGLPHICFSQLLSWTLGGVMVKELSICRLSKGFRENLCPSVNTFECASIAKHGAYTAKPSEACRRYRSSWTEVEHCSGKYLSATEFRAHRSVHLYSL